MPAPVVVRFAVAGMSEVDSACASMSQRLRKMNEQIANDSKKSTAKRVQNTRQGVDLELKEVEKWVARSKAADDKWVADNQKAQDQRARNAEKTASRLNKIQEKYTKEAQKLDAQAARDAERAQQAVTRTHEREAKRREQIDQKASSSASRAAHKIVQPFGRAARSTIGTVGGVVGGLGAASASMMIGASLMDTMALQGQANLLVNSTRDKGGNATQTVGGLTGEAQSLAGKYGVGAGDVMKGMNVVAARAGGSKGLTAYRSDIEDITKTAVAFGVSMEDMGGVVAAALNAGVKPGEEMRQLIQDIAAMGKDGAVEIKDLASELAKLGGSGKMTNLSAGTMLRRQVGMAQVAADAAVSPEESRTAIVDLMRDINTNARHLKGAGINVYDKNNMMNDPAQLLAETMDVAMKKGISVRGRGQVKGSEALGAIFTGSSHKIVESLMADYNKGGKEGVMARINAASGAQLAPGERDAGVAQMLKDPSTQLRMAMETLKADIGNVLLPELVKLAPVLSSVTKSFAQLVAWAAQNPFSALTSVFGGYLAKELAAVGMSKMFEAGIKEILMTVSGGPNGTPGVNGATGGVPGKIAAIGTIALTAAAVYLTATKVIDEISDTSKRKGASEFSTLTGAENTLRVLGSKKGALTAEELSTAKAARESIAGIQEDRSSSGLGKAWKRLMNLDIVGAAEESTVFGRTFEKANKGAGGAFAAEDPKVLLAGFDKLIGAADKMNAAADKMGVASGSLSNPNANARSGKPAGMGK